MAEADTRIDPVASDAASGCDIDPSSQHLLDAERPYIDARRLTRDWQTAAPLTALALSGGGIRSAAFALGVMQKFAAADYLRLFDYLSTVSGGGFIGSSLTWFTSGLFKAKTSVDFGLDPTLKGGERQPFPYGSADPGMPVIGAARYGEDLPSGKASLASAYTTPPNSSSRFQLRSSTAWRCASVSFKPAR